ncbi:MFS transporter [Labrys okinawensis]|uniref:MFS transporter n=1 Tax=Labrys okinawensis TaxID=346911 RepID=UPI0039BD0E5E
MRNTDNTSRLAAETLSPVSNPALQVITADMLADRLPASVFVPYLLVAFVHTMAYGSSFLLSDLLRSVGYEGTVAGSVISAGILATLVGALFAGHVAERAGIIVLVSASVAVMAGAMTCFALTGTGGLPFAYAGGLLLGLGWALFYMLAPIQIIHCLKPASRLEALMLLSGSQMLGLGIAAPLGRFVAGRFGGPGAAYVCYGALCVLAAALVLFIRPKIKNQPQLPMHAVALSLKAVFPILRARTVLPVMMMGIAACIFAGLSVFQSLYAQSRDLAPDIFFLTFTVTTVALRFSGASLVGKLPLGPLAFTLFLVTLAGIGLLTVNGGNVTLYIAATILFATGYGLTYSTLNAMVVNLAGERNLSVPVASQVFTLGYFVGQFGFPYIGGSLIAARGIDAALLAMIGLVAVNIAIASLTLKRSA